VFLGDVLADVNGIEQHDFLAKIARMMNKLDDLFPWISVDFLVVRHIQSVFGGHMFSEARHLKDLITNVAKNLD